VNRPQKHASKKRAGAGRSDSHKPVASKPSPQKSGEPPRDPAEVRAESFRVAAQRETVEAFVVAFILALLFRAFLAEAFVIPTGSMAPTLMGAHKDIVCDRCQTSYQCGASLERKGPNTENVVVATICPNCRHTNALDLVESANDGTFNGDRILVSKFSYTLNEPERWDVIVFKYPGNPKQNYIKRLVGLPNEVVSIRHGDVYARPMDADAQGNTILRKPPRKLLAMRHLVYDTDHQSPALIQAGYPSRWQPWTEKATAPPTNSWNIVREQDGLTATVTAKDDSDFEWMRYYHRWPDEMQWQRADEGQSLADVDPYSSRLITDFYAYNAYVNVYADRVFKFEEEPATFRGSRLERVLNGGYSKGGFRADYQSGVGPEQFDGAAGYGNHNLARDGMHWVADLILEADVETSADCSELLLELVEAGVKYRCRIDLASGTATLRIDDIEDRFFDDAQSANGAGQRTATTSIRGGQRHHVRFSNCDDELLLWVDGGLVEFDGPTTFDARTFRSDDENYPQYLAEHPLDAAPAAIAIRGGSSTVHNLRIDRDKYYIATSISTHMGLDDYDDQKLWQFGRRAFNRKEIQEVFTQPERWTEFLGWQIRRTVEFALEEDQFFPMGDNSPESLDARCWAGTKGRLRLPRDVNEEAYRWTDASYVPRDLLVGKALVVFWPHSWNSPVPFIPNVKRMKLIR
jgi:signal peptidase I